jgi:hypothetical protein
MLCSTEEADAIDGDIVAMEDGGEVDESALVGRSAGGGGGAVFTGGPDVATAGRTGEDDDDDAGVGKLVAGFLAFA